MMRLVCFLFFFLTLFSSCEKNSYHRTQASHLDIQRILQTIPDQDRAILDSFFQLLFRDYNFSYTLFGNKPLSMACYSPQATSWTLYHPSEFLIFEKGWELWKSYNSFFS